MDKLIIILLPTDIWSVVADYLFKYMHIRRNSLPKYKYILDTFVKNIDYIKNKQFFERNPFYDITDLTDLPIVKYGNIKICVLFQIN